MIRLHFVQCFAYSLSRSCKKKLGGEKSLSLLLKSSKATGRTRSRRSSSHRRAFSCKRGRKTRRSFTFSLSDAPFFSRTISAPFPLASSLPLRLLSSSKKLRMTLSAHFAASVSSSSAAKAGAAPKAADVAAASRPPSNAPRPSLPPSKPPRGGENAAALALPTASNGES